MQRKIQITANVGGKPVDCSPVTTDECIIMTGGSTLREEMLSMVECEDFDGDDSDITVEHNVLSRLSEIEQKLEKTVFTI